MRELVSTKVASFDPSDVVTTSEFGTLEQISYRELVFRYASISDKLMCGSAWLASMLFGASLPAFTLIFGEMIDSIGANSGFESLGTQAKWMLFIGAGVYVFSFFQVSLFSIFAENISHKVKINYFRACLAKDAAWFDENNPTEMAAKIAKETLAI